MPGRWSFHLDDKNRTKMVKTLRLLPLVAPDNNFFCHPERSEEFDTVGNVGGSFKPAVS